MLVIRALIVNLSALYNRAYWKPGGSIDWPRGMEQSAPEHHICSIIPYFPVPLEGPSKKRTPLLALLAHYDR